MTSVWSAGSKEVGRNLIILICNAHYHCLPLFTPELSLLSFVFDLEPKVSEQAVGSKGLLPMCP